MAEKEQKEPNFETSLERLEQIVQQMESEKLPLEKLLKSYEEGIQLVKTCTRRLDEAEKRIQIITEKGGNKPGVEEFEPDSSVASTPVVDAKPEKGETESNDIRLL